MEFEQHVTCVASAPGPCCLDTLPFQSNALKRAECLLSSKAFYLLLSFGGAGVYVLAKHQPFLFIPDLSCLLQGDLGVRTDAVVLLFAVLGGRITVTPNPVFTASGVYLQQKTPAI